MDESIREKIESVAKEMHKVWSTCGEHESSKFEVFCFLAKWHIQRTLEAKIHALELLFINYVIGKVGSFIKQYRRELQQLKDG